MARPRRLFSYLYAAPDVAARRHLPPRDLCGCAGRSSLSLRLTTRSPRGAAARDRAQPQGTGSWPITAARGLNAQWRELFQEFRYRDLPDHADAGLRSRTNRRIGRRAASISTARIIPIPTSSPGPASRRCPCCHRPQSQSAPHPMDCRSACRSSARIWKTARRLKLAELIEREFGGFVPPKMFDDYMMISRHGERMRVHPCDRSLTWVRASR